MSALLEGFRALGPARLVALAAVAAGLLAFLAVMSARGGGGGRMALMYADLDTREAAQIAEQLDAQHIAHEVSAAGDRILVPESEVGRARLLLARQGLPSGGSIGYELFDRGDGLTASSFQHQINQARALEGELARTIRTIVGVRAARVHLVLPKREPFARQQQDAQASVLLTMVGGARLDREGVQAVLNLVSAAVPGLRPQNVAVVDSRGDLLARAGAPADGVGAAQTLDAARHASETRLARAVEEMLERTLGPGRVRAEASIDFDYAQVRETQERFDPDGQVARSTQSVTDSGKNTEPGTTVSVQNNLPNADAGAKEGAASQTQRQEETTNYEVGKTVRTLVREQPEIRRVSLAVLVDGETVMRDGKPDWKPRAPEELDRLAALIRGAIGFDEKRGDKVEVVNLRFVSEEFPTAAEPPRLLGLAIEPAMVARLAQTGLVGVLGLVALLLVLRPMVVRLTTLPAGVAMIGSDAMADGRDAAMLAATPGGGANAMLTHERGAVARLSGPASMAGSEDEDMVDLAHIEGQMRAASIRRVADLVDRHPEESLSLVRAWMQRENA